MSVRELTSRQRQWLVAWGVLLGVLFVGIGLTLVLGVRSNQRAATARHAARIDPDADEPGVTAAERVLAPNARPVRVAAGIYLDRVVELSIRDTSWIAEFYLWFRWRGDSLKSCERFDIVDGSIEKKELEVDETIEGERYQRFRVLAKISKFFDVSRFPCDDHLLTIGVEIPGMPREELLFVADTDASAVSSRVRILSYDIERLVMLEKPHSYRTSRGDPRWQAGSKATYSQLRAGIKIRRSGWGMFIKLFQSLYVAVVLAVLAFFIQPTDVDPRFGLGVGALFAAVANAYVISSLVPDSGGLALADLINGIGIGVILLTVLESTLSLYLFSQRGEESFARALDRVSFVVILPGYLLLNLLLPIVASA